MNMLYDKDAKLYASNYLEIYVPMEYFEDNNFAINKGNLIETFGILYIQEYIEGKAKGIKLLNIPTNIELMLYENEIEEISINGKSLNVLTLKYLQDSYVLRQSITKDKKIAERFLNLMLMGKLPKTVAYNDTINFWLKNLEISGINYNVPSKVYEMIIANVYRNPSNIKDRFGQIYGKQTNPNPHGYVTKNVRDIVALHSSFSGLVFEDMQASITNAINNSLNGEIEQTSPLEKIIYY